MRRTDAKFCSSRCCNKFYELHHNRSGYYYEYYFINRKLDPLKVYLYRKRAWEHKYPGMTYPYGPEHEAFVRRK